MASAAFEAFVAPARARPQIWRLVLGLALAAAVYILGIFAVFGAVWALTPTDPDFLWAERILEADTPQAMLILLATFTGMALGPMLAARLLHRRRAASLFGPAARSLREFAVAAATVGGILGASVLVWSLFYDGIPNLDPARWLALLPFAALGVLVQTGAEEILFRGYLQQQLAARFRSAAVWLLGPAVLFGIVHYDPASAGGSVWIVVGAATLFGLIAGDLTARTGSLGAAWGFHFANNMVALTVISTEGSLTGLALYTTPYSLADTETLGRLVAFDLAAMGLAWLVLRRLLGR